MLSATAPAAVVRDDEQLTLGWLHLMQRLSGRGVTVRMAELPAEDVGVWDSATQTLEVRDDAPLEDQVWLMHEAWAHLVIGPHASPTARRERPTLHLVPFEPDESLPA